MYKETSIKKRIFDIIQIENKNDFASKFFDIFIIITIISNIIVMFLRTFENLNKFNTLFHIIEVITISIFCIEYILRIWTANYLYPKGKPLNAILKFLISFDGIIDLLTILPFFLFSGFVVFRMLRVVRIFHLFRINAKYDSFHVITTVLCEKKNQIASSTFIILVLMFASSLCMYSVEHEVQPEVFSNAFSGLWWAMSTLLTIGYGDIYPITILGKIMAIVIAFLGVGAVAIPTGIIGAGFVEQYSKIKNIGSITRETPIQFISFKITKNHNWKNLLVKDASIPQGLTLVMVLRNDDIITPKGDLKLIENDVIVIAAKTYVDEKSIFLDEIVLNEDDEWCNTAIKDLDISRLSTIISIKRKNHVIIPNGDTILHPNDVIVMYTKNKKDKEK